jgi:nucleoside-diphosphate-sugar epimerase
LRMIKKQERQGWDPFVGTGQENLAVRYQMERVFWPSSIAAFGPHTPRIHTHQLTVMDPNTMYGITKVTGELLCNYYFVKYGLDVRCLRYPGIISWKTLPAVAQPIMQWRFSTARCVIP